MSDVGVDVWKWHLPTCVLLLNWSFRNHRMPARRCQPTRSTSTVRSLGVPGSNVMGPPCDGSPTSGFAGPVRLSSPWDGGPMRGVDRGQAREPLPSGDL